MQDKIPGDSLNDKLANSFVTLTANFSRLSASESLVVQGILKSLELEIVNTLQNNPDLTEWRKARFEALLMQTRETIAANYNSITSYHDSFLETVVKASSSLSAEVFSIFRLPIQAVAFSSHTGAILAQEGMIQGAPSAAWWAKQSQNLQDAFIREMRMGYASGESIAELVRRVRGVPTGKKNNYVINGKTKVFMEYQGGIMDVGTRQAQALVRTSVQQISADVKMRIFQKNADILKGVMWLATLDARTTPLCRARDGLLYSLDGKPIGHDVPFLTGPPAHWNCRSTLVPVTKSFEELGATPGITKNYLDAIPPATRASMTGQVPAALTFDAWFNGLPEKDQIAFLGKKKFEIWKKAGLNFQDMVNPQGNPLTVEQLAEAYGVKIEHARLTGIPNIPKQMVSAIAVEQEAQALASQALAEAAKQEKANALAALESFSASQDSLKNQVYQEFQDQIDKENPEKTLLFLEKQVEVEKAAQDKLAKLASDTESPAEGKKYIRAMETKTALALVNEELLPSMQLKTFEKELKKLRKVNAVAYQELQDKLEKDSAWKDYFSAWKGELKASGQGVPFWDMKKLNVEFENYVASLDKIALEKINNKLANATPLEAEIFSNLWKQVAIQNETPPLGQLPSLVSDVFEKAGATYAEEKKIALKLKSLQNESSHFSSIVDELQKSGITLPSELQKQAMEKYALVEKAAQKELADMLANPDAATQKAWTNAQAQIAGKADIQKLEIFKHELTLAKEELAQVAMQEIKLLAGNFQLENTVVKVGTKEFDLSQADQVTAFKKYKSQNLSKYKQAIVAGKEPTPLQKQIYNALAPDEKEIFDDSVSNALAKKTTPKPVVPNENPEKPRLAPETLNFAQMEKYGAQKGSNLGGFYRDKVTGKEYYIKFPASEDIARNELLAAKLYQAAGVDVPELTLIFDGDKAGIASRIKTGLKRASAKELAQAIGASQNYAVDAWLANWDVVGLDYDNLLLTEAGTAFRVDVGGALRYRAQGGLKGQFFGTDVLELESLRDARINPQSASVFGKLKQSELEAGISKILALPDEKIRQLIAEFGPHDEATAKELANILIARKEYLAKKFPHLSRPSVVKPAIEAGELIGEAEFQSVKNARINGYTIPADKDKIEDQNILFWFEKDKDGNDITGLSLKFTDIVKEDIKKIVGSSSWQYYYDQKRFRNLIISDFNSFREFLEDAVTHVTDFQDLQDAGTILKQRIRDIKAEYKKLRKHMDTYGFSELFEEIDKIYAGPLHDLEKSVKKTKIVPYGVFKQDISQAEFMTIKVETIADRLKERTAANNKMGFVYKEGQYYLSDTKNGFARQTNQVLERGGYWRYVYETKTQDGVIIRVWPNEETAGRALENQIEIIAPGKSKASMERALKIIRDDFNLPVGKPTNIDREYMYLRMIARHRGDWKTLDTVDDLIKSGQTTENATEFLKKELSEKIGTDVTKLQGYNPWGTHEAFDTGFTHFYLPGVNTDKEWQNIFDNYILEHESFDLVGTLDAVLNSGGKMVPTASKWRYGINWSGLSPERDMETGGADYFFTRFFKKQRMERNYPTFIWDSRQLARLDIVHYDFDNFGRTVDNNIRKLSKQTPAEHIAASNGEKNEVMFKNGLSLFDGLKYINCKDAEQMSEVARILAKHGWKEKWIDGRPISEILLIRGKPLQFD